MRMPHTVPSCVGFPTQGPGETAQRAGPGGFRYLQTRGHRVGFRCPPSSQQLLLNLAVAKGKRCRFQAEYSGEARDAVSHSFIPHKQGLHPAKHPPPPAAVTARLLLQDKEKVAYQTGSCFPCPVRLPADCSSLQTRGRQTLLLSELGWWRTQCTVPGTRWPRIIPALAQGGALPAHSST